LKFDLLQKDKKQERHHIGHGNHYKHQNDQFVDVANKGSAIGINSSLMSSSAPLSATATTTAETRKLKKAKSFKSNQVSQLKSRIEAAQDTQTFRTDHRDNNENSCSSNSNNINVGSGSGSDSGSEKRRKERDIVVLPCDLRNAWAPQVFRSPSTTTLLSLTIIRY